MFPPCRFVFVLSILMVRIVIAELPAPPRPWNDYRTIMWVGGSVWKRPDRFPLFVQRLKEMGINTATVHGDNGTATASNGSNNTTE